MLYNFLEEEIENIGVGCESEKLERIRDEVEHLIEYEELQQEILQDEQIKLLYIWCWRKKRGTTKTRRTRRNKMTTTNLSTL
jgi:hypothetical protein